MNDGTEIPEDESARAGLLDRVSVPWHVALGASAEETFVHNPLTEGFSALDKFMANNPRLRAPGMFGQSADAPMPVDPSYDTSDGPADQFVDPKTLNAQYGQSLGLTFDKPTRAGSVAITVRRKQEEIARTAALDRAPPGLAYGIANLATQLAVSATDPLNVASAFIPIVPEARSAIWAAKYGKTASRFATGAIEGSVGASAIEPVNYGASKYLGDDYTMGDSLLNVALGGMLGGGLHVGFGAISDHLSRLAPETRDAALRGSIANMAEGRPVEVDHIISADPLYRRFDELPTIQDLKLASDEARLQAEHDTLGEQIKALPPGDAKAQDSLARLSAVDEQLKAPDLETEIRKALSTRRDQILTDTTPEKLQAAAQPIVDRQKLTAQQARLADELAGVGQKRTSLAAQTALTPPHITAAADAAAARFRGLYNTEPRDPAAMLQAQREGSTAVTQAADRHQTAALDRARTASVDYGRNVERSTAVSPDSSTNGDRVLREKLGDDLDTEHAEAQATIDAYEKQGALTPEEAAQARSGKEDIALAAKQGKAARAAALCLLLHP